MERLKANFELASSKPARRRQDHKAVSKCHPGPTSTCNEACSEAGKRALLKMHGAHPIAGINQQNRFRCMLGARAIDSAPSNIELGTRSKHARFHKEDQLHMHAVSAKSITSLTLSVRGNIRANQQARRPSIRQKTCTFSARTRLLRFVVARGEST